MRKRGGKVEGCTPTVNIGCWNVAMHCSVALGAKLQSQGACKWSNQYGSASSRHPKKDKRGCGTAVEASSSLAALLFDETLRM